MEPSHSGISGNAHIFKVKKLGSKIVTRTGLGIGEGSFGRINVMITDV